MFLDPFPPINKAFSMVAQQKRQMSNTGMIEPPSEKKIFAVNTDKHIGSRRGLLMNPNQYTGNGRGRGNKGRCRNNTGRGGVFSNKLCTHCGRTNHTIDTCYFKHGFPPGYRPRQSNANVCFVIQNCCICYIPLAYPICVCLAMIVYAVYGSK